jgi:hypothetical protein
MPIKNFTTRVDENKTVSEIQQLLASHGAMQVSVQYQAMKPVAVTFVLMVTKIPVQFRLPRNADGVLRALKQQRGVPQKCRNFEHASRVSWRILKDWVDAQIAVVEAQQAELAEVFLPYAMEKDGLTLYQLYQRQKALPPKSGDVE